MAVICEAISVVIRADRVIQAFGSLTDFHRIVPNRTLAADNELVRVGFMTPDDVGAFIKKLDERGLTYIENGRARDLVVVDQIRGPAVQCEWIEFGQTTLKGRPVAAARLTGSISQQLMTPDGWTFEGSVTQTFGFVPTGEEVKSLKFLRTENEVDVYLNTLTGSEVFVGRTTGNEGR